MGAVIRTGALSAAPRRWAMGDGEGRRGSHACASLVRIEAVVIWSQSQVVDVVIKQ